MEELDVVKLTCSYKGLQAGTLGTIVLKYDESHFEVEFFDNDDETIGVYTTPLEVLASINDSERNV
ncbi:MAG: DUF4926 domain-containing protein [Oscillospiraceae bacterium]|nr:DUF4926 domain-containing protein [Oscillospiraceae bacterium]